jgi:hypothetical protein
MSLPLMFRTCRFLIIAIASTPAVWTSLLAGVTARFELTMRLWKRSPVRTRPRIREAAQLAPSLQRKRPFDRTFKCVGEWAIV